MDDKGTGYRDDVVWQIILCDGKNTTQRRYSKWMIKEQDIEMILFGKLFCVTVRIRHSEDQRISV